MIRVNNPTIDFFKHSSYKRLFNGIRSILIDVGVTWYYIYIDDICISLITLMHKK